MPHYKGRSDVFHLMSRAVSPLDHDLAVVYLPLMPVRLVELLESRGINFVEVPDEEFDTMGCNVLALGPRHAMMVEGNPETEHRMRGAGVKVEVIKGYDICRKGEGGPTCMTGPWCAARRDLARSFSEKFLHLLREADRHAAVLVLDQRAADQRGILDGKRHGLWPR